MSGLVYIKTFGCQMNEYDSSKMQDVLEAANGMTRAEDPAQADLLLVNTCSVREKAQEKVFSLLGEWRLHKQQRPHVVIGVGGCVASQEGEGTRGARRSAVWCSARRRCTACPRCSRILSNRDARKSTSASRKSKNSIVCPRPVRQAPRRS